MHPMLVIFPLFIGGNNKNRVGKFKNILEDSTKVLENNVTIRTIFFLKVTLKC